MKIAKYIIIGVLALSMVAGMVACNTAPSVDKTTETEISDDSKEATKNESADVDEEFTDVDEEKTEESKEDNDKESEKTKEETTEEATTEEEKDMTDKWVANDTKDSFAVGLSDDAAEVFEEATEGLEVNYESIALVATQVVSGTNYKILCYVGASDKKAESGAAILANAEGNASVAKLDSFEEGTLVYLTIYDSLEEKEKAVITEQSVLDLQEMSETVNSMGTPRELVGGYSAFEDETESELGDIKDLFKEYTSASAATCSYKAKAILGSKTLEDGTVDYAILCTRNLTNKNGEKLDCGIAFLHVGETRNDTFMRQVHLLDFSE